VQAFHNQKGTNYLI